VANSGCGDEKLPPDLIDERIEALADRRGKRLARLRGLIREADPDMAEDWRAIDEAAPRPLVREAVAPNAAL
jgi:hypothetical protein